MKTNEQLAKAAAEEAVNISVSAYQRPALTKADAVADVASLILAVLTESQAQREATTPTPDAVKLAGELLERIWAAIPSDPVPCTKHEIGSILLPVLTAQQAEHAAVVARLEMERDVARASRRWNIEETKDGFRLCRGEHDKSDSCSFVEYVPLADLSAARADLEASRENSGRLLTDLTAARAEVERLKYFENCMISQVNMPDYSSRCSHQEVEIFQLRAQLTALRERAEGLAVGLTETLCCIRNCVTTAHERQYAEEIDAANAALTAYRAAIDSAMAKEGRE